MGAASEFTVESIQVSIWASNNDVPIIPTFRCIVNSGSAFESDPEFLPSFGPLDIPIVVLKSKDQSSKLEIAQNRINAYWNKTSESSVNLREQALDLGTILGHLSSEVPFAAGRLALVVGRWKQSTDAVSEIGKLFLSPTVLPRPGSAQEGDELDLRIQMRSELPSGLTVNNWLRVSNRVLVPPMSGTVLFIEQDINTLASRQSEASFDPLDVQNFVTSALASMDQWVDKALEE